MRHSTLRISIKNTVDKLVCVIIQIMQKELRSPEFFIISMCVIIAQVLFDFWTSICNMLSDLSSLLELLLG